MSITSLIAAEGWALVADKGKYFVRTEYEELPLIPAGHPVLIHLAIYKNHPNAEVRFQHLKKAHHCLWPTSIWHDWTERRFRAHCEGYNYITLAAGASAAKSHDMAQLAILFWYAAPTERNVTIASVTLNSLMTRVWGYLTKHIKDMAVPLPYKYFRSSPPHVLYEEPRSGKNKIEDDTLHGIFAVTARSGDDDQAVATWIGKHPKDKILLILDECTDMPMSILNALPNLNSHPEKFQLIGIGNSNSTMDLHGLLSTPKNGWDSVSPELTEWETTQINGICQYFSPYESPAINDPDPVRRAILEKFLIGKATLEAKEKELGVDSEKFYRWVLGFWKSQSTEATVASKKFLNEFDPRNAVEWSGLYPVMRLAGLDPAFSTGGDNAVLRIANVGHSIDNKVKIDFGKESMMHILKLLATGEASIEMQLATQVVDLLVKYNVTLDNLAVDCTGQGRAIAEVIRMVNEKRGYPLGFGVPMKVYAMSPHNTTKQKKSVPDLTPVSSYELWMTMRDYISQGQVCNLDETTIFQITTRLIVRGHTGKDKLESKPEYKRRLSAIGRGHSPDQADATALCFQVLKKRWGIEPGSTWSIPKYSNSADLEKLILHVAGKTPPGAAPMPKPNFGGGLDNYIKYKRAF